MICPNCGDKDVSFSMRRAWSGDGWNEPREYEEWLVCSHCGKPTDWSEVEAVNTLEDDDECSELNTIPAA